MVIRAARQHTARVVAMMRDRRTPRTIRVVVGDVPRLLREILDTALGAHADIELFSSADAGLLRSVETCGADALIIAGEVHELRRQHHQVLVEHPLLKIFVVTDDGRAVHQLELLRTPIAEVSPIGIVDAIRRAVLRDREARPGGETEDETG
jgi:hypothetical protein